MKNNTKWGQYALTIAAVMMLAAAFVVLAANDDNEFDSAQLGAGEECSIDDELYATLDLALLAVKDGETIKLLNDVNYTDPITIEGITVNFDLGNYNLNIETAEGDAALTVKDKDGAKGKLDLVGTGTGKLNVKSTSGNGIIAVNSTVTVNGTVNAKECGVKASAGSTVTTGAITSAAASAVYVLGVSTTVTVNGNITTTSNANGITVGDPAETKTDGAVVTVTGDISANGIGNGMTLHNCDATVTVTGSISGNDGIQILGFEDKKATAKVDVTGNITAATKGVYVLNFASADITIGGSINATLQHGVSVIVDDVTETAELTMTVTGDITAGWAGMTVSAEAYGNGAPTATATITVGGKIDSGRVGIHVGALADSGTGAATATATITVGGDVKSGDTSSGIAMGATSHDEGDATIDANITVGGKVEGDGEGIYLFAVADDKGDATIDANITVTGKVKSANTKTGVDIYGDTSATITVNGGIDAGGYGIDVDDGTATIVVKGGIVSQGSGILVNSEATADITVKGGIDASNGFNGLEIYGTVTIEVTGDIKSGPASNGIYIPKGTADITVHGNIISGFEGIYIEDGATATITVNGEITPGVASCEVSFDGDAVEPKEAKTNGYTEYSGVGSDDEPWIVWVSGTTKVPASLVIKNPKTSYMLDGKFTLKGAVWLVYTNGMTEELKAGYVSSIVPGTVLDTKGVFSVTVTYECAFGVFTADDFDITVKGADVKSDSVIMLPVFAIFGGILGAVYFLANKKP